MTNSKNIGNLGELIAKNYLEKRGCTIVHCNYYSRFGEIDIIALEPLSHDSRKTQDTSNSIHRKILRPTLLFIEVKYRKNERFSSAASSITPKKQERMRLTIESYLQENPTINPLRIDLITVIGQEPFQITWLKNIF